MHNSEQMQSCLDWILLSLANTNLSSLLPSAKLRCWCMTCCRTATKSYCDVVLFWHRCTVHARCRPAQCIALGFSFPAMAPCLINHERNSSPSGSQCCSSSMSGSIEACNVASRCRTHHCQLILGPMPPKPFHFWAHAVNILHYDTLLSLILWSTLR